MEKVHGKIHNFFHGKEEAEIIEEQHADPDPDLVGDPLADEPAPTPDPEPIVDQPLAEPEIPREYSDEEKALWKRINAGKAEFKPETDAKPKKPKAKKARAKRKK